MVNKELNIPFYIKASIFFLGMIALTAILYVAQDIIIPLVFSIIIAIVLNPIVNFFVRIKINRIVSIVFTLFLTFLVISAFGVFIFSQVRMFSDSWPLLVNRFTELVNQITTWSSGYFSINPKYIHEFISKIKGELLNTSSSAIGQTIVYVGNGVLVLFLIPVYTFIIMYYQPLLMDFIHRLFEKNTRKQVNEIVNQIKTVVQLYLTGLVIEVIVVSILYTAVLFILGIDYAILLGILGGLLNLIPYVGGLVGAALPMMIAIVTKSTAWPALYIMFLFYIIQLIDNNYLFPAIVASKVRINVLFSIIAVIAGNALWGISGMFLSIPLLAVVKLIFDHIESLKPWGFLLGDTMPPVIKLKPGLLKIKDKLTK